MRCGDLARNVAPSGNRRSPAVDPSTTDKPVAIRMANDPRYRSSRPDRLSQDRPSGDPLSELARLIGQDDAVAATARNGASRRQRDPGDREELPPRRGNPSPEELHEDSRAGPDRHGRYEDADPRQAAYLAESPAPGLREGDGYDPRGGNGTGYQGYEEDAGFRRGTETDDRGHYGDGEEAEAYDAPAYDDRYDEDPEAAGGYDNGPYYGEDGREEPYEEVPPRRRSRLFPLAVVLGVAVVGTAAAYAYRTWTNPGSEAPPVIKANTEPTKLMATGSDGQPGKQIYDRLDKGQGQNEQVVPREEEPVNLAARSATDALTSSGAAATGSLGGLPSGGPVASPPMLSGGTPSTDGEPRRVRTIPIRPEQGSGAGTADANAVAPAVESPAAAAPTPAVQPPAVQAPAAPAPTSRSRRTAKPAPAPVAPAAPVAPTEPPPQQAAESDPQATHPPPAPSPTSTTGQPRRVAAVSNAADGAGHYLVQVSSQRSEADAQASYKALQQKYASVLGGHDPIIRRADLGDKGTFYRAQVGPFATMDEANQLCNSLKSAGGQCIIQRN
jgi:cell division septation protein DedD